MIEFECPHCHEAYRLAVDRNRHEEEVRCIRCRQTFLVVWTMPVVHVLKEAR